MWFQDPTRGPSDHERQYRAVLEVLSNTAPDIVALQEIASEDAFERLQRDLPQMAGVLSGYSWVQKTGLLWNAERFELVRARAITGLQDAGRPPLAVLLRSKARHTELLAIVIHAKADAEPSSYAQRVEFARGLKRQLDAQAQAAPIALLGDFNDLLSSSLLPDAPSPYQEFVEDRAYAAPTRDLDRAPEHETSYATGASVDHIIVSAELADRASAADTNVLRDELLPHFPRFAQTVSDHFPVTLQLSSSSF